MTLASLVVCGALAGLHAATWGAYKDAPFEGFRTLSYLRSIVIGALVAVGVAGCPWVQHSVPVVVSIGVIYALERLATEWWKSILREDDQRAYTIPMRLGVRGRTVDRKSVRYAVGVLVVVTLTAMIGATAALQHAQPGLPPWVVVLTVGGAGGWTTAVGGAWKDAPVEGFSSWKFVRSPVVAMLWAVPLSLLTTNWAVLGLAAAGLAVASIETYKTFLTGGRPPGKFATRPVRFHLPTVRRVLTAMHASLWAALAVTLTTGLAVPVHGIGWPELVALDGQLPSMLEGVVAGGAACLAALVLVCSFGLGGPESR